MPVYILSANKATKWPLSFVALKTSWLNMDQPIEVSACRLYNGGMSRKTLCGAETGPSERGCLQQKVASPTDDYPCLWGQVDLALPGLDPEAPGIRQSPVRQIVFLWP